MHEHEHRHHQRQQAQSRPERLESKHALGVERTLHDETGHRKLRQADQQGVREQLPILQQLQPQQRHGDPELPADEAGQQHHAACERRDHRRRRRPQRSGLVGGARLPNRPHHKRQAGEQHGRPEPVDAVVGRAGTSGASCGEQQQRRRGHGQVEPEDPRPAEGLGDDPSQRRAEGHEEHRDADVDRHRLATLAGGEVLDDQRRRGGLHETRGETLQQAGDDQLGAIGGEATRHAGEGEQHHADRERANLAE